MVVAYSTVSQYNQGGSISYDLLGPGHLSNPEMRSWHQTSLGFAKEPWGYRKILATNQYLPLSL